MAKNIEPKLRKIGSYLQLEEDTIFVIPEYQRPYSWGITNCDKLWQDIIDYNDGDSKDNYFFGTIIINCDNDDIMALNADASVIEQSKHELSRMEAILGNDATINTLVVDILDHYENNRENLLTGKAMIVAYSREIAMKIYHRILEIHPDWTEKVAVVMTSSNKDPEEWRDIIGNKAHKNELVKKHSRITTAL